MVKRFCFSFLFCFLLVLLGKQSLSAQSQLTVGDSSLAAAFHALAQQHDAMRGDVAAQAVMQQEYSALYARLLDTRSAGEKPAFAVYDEAIATARTFGLVRNALTLLQLQEADHPHNSTECHCGKCHKD